MPVVPAPAPSSSITTTTTNTAENKNQDADEDEDDEPDPVKTFIGSSVYLSAGSHVHAGATIHDAVILESNVSVLRGVTVGAHSKICAGVTVDHDVDAWTVVLGNGDVRRPRRPRQRQRRRHSDTGLDGEEGKNEDEDSVELIESLRLKAMDKEREGTVMIYRATLRTAGLAKKK